jgi:hypothetical protein
MPIDRQLDAFPLRSARFGGNEFGLIARTTNATADAARPSDFMLKTLARLKRRLLGGAVHDVAAQGCIRL